MSAFKLDIAGECVCSLGDCGMVEQFSVGRPQYSVDGLAARRDRVPLGALPERSADHPAVTCNFRVPLGGLPKRVVDLVGASLGLVLLSPLMLTVALLICAVLGKPVIFSQRRVGFNGKSFVCYKFRSMVKDADAVLRRHLSADEAAASEWRETQKLKNDPRVNGLGRVLRKASIDELPQLYNVLRGDMSLVGPRPVLPDELARYGRHTDAYLQARPGMTGMWQANGRNSVGYRGRVARDRYYARHWSLVLDLHLLVKTIPAMLDFRKTS
jgi:exopolysaccharide production protein ExoY